MKNIILLFALAFVLSSCTKEIDQSQLQIRGGLAYEANSDKPFSGKVNTKNKEEDRGFVTYDDGILDGKFKTTERIPGYDKIIIEGQNKEGKLDGLVTTTYIHNGQRQSEVEYENGIPKGTVKFWTQNGELIKNEKIDYSKCSLYDKFKGSWSVISSKVELLQFGHVVNFVNESTCDVTYLDYDGSKKMPSQQFHIQLVKGNTDLFEYNSLDNGKYNVEEITYCDYTKIITKYNDNFYVWYRIAP